MAVLLVLWWVVHPAVQRWVGHYDAVHLLLVSLVGLAAAVSLWRRQRVTLGVPAVCTLVALVSLGLATFVSHPDRFPAHERWAAGLTGLAHAVFFLAVLGWVPRRGEHPDDVAHRHEPDVQDARRFRKGLALLWVAMVAVQAVAVAGQLEGELRPAGTLGNPNVLGALVVAAGLSVAAAGRWRPAVAVPLAGFVVVLLLTRSRGALAAGSIVLLLLAARRSWRTLVVVGLGLAALLVLVPNPLSERILSLRSEHHFGRLFFWSVALDHILEFPLGIGAGCNRFVFPAAALHPDFPWLLHGRHAVGLTHNVMLTLTLEWGWLAGVAGLALLGWTAARISPRRGPRDALGQAAVVGAGVLFLEAQVDGLEQNAHAFSLLLFLGALALARAPGRVRGPALPARAVAGLTVVVSLFLGWQAADRIGRLTTLSEARAALTAWRAGELPLEDARAAVGAAIERAPQTPEPWVERFVLESSLLRRAEADATLADPAGIQAAITAAHAALDTARRLHPADHRLLRRAADWTLSVWRRTGKDPRLLARYLELMEALLALDPLDLEARLQLATEFQRIGRQERFEFHLAELFHYEPDDALAWFSLAVFRQLDGEREAALYAYLRTQEALFNCRTKLGIDNPASQAYYQRRLDEVDLDRVRRAIAQLRRELYG